MRGSAAGNAPGQDGRGSQPADRERDFSGSQDTGSPEPIKGSPKGGTQDINRTGSARSATPGATGRGGFDEGLEENNLGEEGGISGARSGTTGLGSERDRGTTSSPGGVEGVSNRSEPDEDLERKR